MWLLFSSLLQSCDSIIKSDINVKSVTVYKYIVLFLPRAHRNTPVWEEAMGWWIDDGGDTAAFWLLPPAVPMSNFKHHTTAQAPPSCQRHRKWSEVNRNPQYFPRTHPLRTGVARLCCVPSTPESVFCAHSCSRCHTCDFSEKGLIKKKRTWLGRGGESPDYPHAAFCWCWFIVWPKRVRNLCLFVLLRFIVFSFIYIYLNINVNFISNMLSSHLVHLFVTNVNVSNNSYTEHDSAEWLYYILILLYILWSFIMSTMRLRTLK